MNFKILIILLSTLSLLAIFIGWPHDYYGNTLGMLRHSQDNDSLISEDEAEALQSAELKMVARDIEQIKQILMANKTDTYGDTWRNLTKKYEEIKSAILSSKLVADEIENVFIMQLFKQCD